jgi:Ca-activated chloride channel family protein
MKHFLVPIAVAGSLFAHAQASQPASGQTKSEAPSITMCILIDNSGSMSDKRAGVMAASLALVRASKPNDEVGIVDFNDEALNGLPDGEDFTRDTKEMEEALTHIDARGGSAMRDAVRTSIDRVEQTAHNARKILVLVTDGTDTSSSVTQEALLSKVKNSGVRVYSIGLLNEATPDQAAAARLALERLADASGGSAYYPKDLAELGSISEQIANAVRKQ